MNCSFTRLSILTLAGAMLLPASVASAGSIAPASASGAPVCSKGDVLIPQYGGCVKEVLGHHGTTFTYTEVGYCGLGSYGYKHGDHAKFSDTQKFKRGAPGNVTAFAVARAATVVIAHGVAWSNLHCYTPKVTTPVKWGTITGTVTNASGAPNTGAWRVIATNKDNTFYPLSVSAAGVYKMTVAASEYTVEFFAPRHGASPRTPQSIYSVRVLAGRTTTVNVTLNS